jgi:thymidine kinase
MPKINLLYSLNSINMNSLSDSSNSSDTTDSPNSPNSPNSSDLTNTTYSPNILESDDSLPQSLNYNENNENNVNDGNKSYKSVRQVNLPKSNGSITLIVGPMFAGKTTQLLLFIDREVISDKKCLIIKHLNDVRYSSDSIVTHSKYAYNKCTIINLAKIDDRVINQIINEKYDVVGIEEGQFFDKIDIYANILANCGIKLYISALDGTFKQTGFENIMNLIPHAENVLKLKAICMKCKNNEASFTIRKTNSDDLIIIGGSEMYMAVCRQCL